MGKGHEWTSHRRKKNCFPKYEKFSILFQNTNQKLQEDIHFHDEFSEDKVFVSPTVLSQV